MLCEGYWDPQGVHHIGFYCPRLSDTSEQSYCCWQGDSLKQCCNQSQFQHIMNVSLTEVSPTELVHSSRPLSLVVVLLYGALVLVLMVMDFLWFCRQRGLTVTAALRKYITCPRLVKGILFPHDYKRQRYHDNRELALLQRKISEGPPEMSNKRV
ncbi:hypothetical protein SKAU_G00349190 [Synaphobranchus kaupii]|uniref:Uncharacterized protein n=1 Tax=Synaphobranchus kaupii TaxID=118154 RepID=A0A9Q1EK14_SYNKA|nr:hypothetical protein SKAU_G00349190 [Synaphobranchus kaupii]